MVAAAAAAKIAVVERDPTELGERRLLNFGHTLGHAIESACGYAGLRHGEAVGYGILFALRLARSRGLKAAAAERIHALILRLGPAAAAGARPRGADGGDGAGQEGARVRAGLGAPRSLGEGVDDDGIAGGRGPAPSCGASCAIRFQGPVRGRRGRFAETGLAPSRSRAPELCPRVPRSGYNRADSRRYPVEMETPRSLLRRLKLRTILVVALLLSGIIPLGSAASC